MLTLLAGGGVECPSRSGLPCGAAIPRLRDKVGQGQRAECAMSLLVKTLERGGDTSIVSAGGVGGGLASDNAGEHKGGVG